MFGKLDKTEKLFTSFLPLDLFLFFLFLSFLKCKWGKQKTRKTHTATYYDANLNSAHFALRHL